MVGDDIIGKRWYYRSSSRSHKEKKLTGNNVGPLWFQVYREVRDDSKRWYTLLTGASTHCKNKSNNSSINKILYY
jgi:hypothetical protein